MLSNMFGKETLGPFEELLHGMLGEKGLDEEHTEFKQTVVRRGYI